MYLTRVHQASNRKMIGKCKRNYNLQIWSIISVGKWKNDGRQCRSQVSYVRHWQRLLLVLTRVCHISRSLLPGSFCLCCLVEYRIFRLQTRILGHKLIFTSPATLGPSIGHHVWVAFQSLSPIIGNFYGPTSSKLWA